MVNIKFIKKLLTIGERNVFHEMNKYIELAKQMDSLLIKMLIEGKDLKECNDNVRKLEESGDELTFNLKENISKGVVSPNSMVSLFNLVEKLDDILDNGRFISREIKRMRLAENGNEVLNSFYSEFVKILNKHLEALDLLSKMLNANTTDEIAQIRGSIEKLEEEVDEIKDNIIDNIYQISGKLTFVEFNHLLSLSHKFDDILDNCEDASDLIMSIILSVES